VTATLEQLIRQEQQRQAELEAFAQQLQQHQQSQAAAVAATSSTAAGTAETSTPLHSAASNSSGSSATPSSRKVRFSADVDQILLPQNEGEAPIRISKSLDKLAADDLEGTVRKGIDAAAAVAAVLGVRWERPKATANAPYAAQISIDNRAKLAAAAAAPSAMQQGVQPASSPFASQQQQLQADITSVADQQPGLGEAPECSASDNTVAQDGNAVSAAEKQEVGQAAAAAAPFSPFGNLKDQPWE
jgi:hypothetical protein